MDELKTVNDIVSDAVKNSSYVTVLISSSVFILYTLIVKIVDLYKSKDKSKPLLEMASAVKEVSENVVKLNQVLDKTIQNAEQKETDRIVDVIINSFLKFKSVILDQCIDTILHNHIDANKESIKQNIYKTVSTEYYKLYSTFSAYEHDSIVVSTKIKEEWIEEVTKECIVIIYNGTDSLNRIRQLNHKLGLVAEEYSIYIKNKILNH
ncbi:MAG: hypothetical protein [crAssphage sp. isolate ctcc615]|uniref:Uncharacterized protein n=1 Tax=crAssphage sp. isolate ctcc615 TaxID=2989853 RepID=A0A345BNY3_9CAUD|nr:MAG: hypothetical protein KNU00_gp62 [crAssphage sp. isolate ctcc615]AXF52154.1 MAG: hypothetical protein [crAssphage sp. isolate ctcc615]